MRTAGLWSVVLGVAALAGGCDTPRRMSPDAGPDVPLPPAECNPIAAEWDCLLPYPSDVFLGTDSVLPAQRRVRVPPIARPTHAGVPIDPTSSHPIDGFSVAAPILAVFPVAIDARELPGPDAPATAAFAPNARTILYDTVERRRLPHIVEVDTRSSMPSRRALIIRPLSRLEHRRRYIVAIRGITGMDGTAIEPPTGFAKLRDGTAGGDPRVGALVDRYDADIFGLLTAASIARDTLQLAWDFTTGSEENVTRDLTETRARALSGWNAAPPRFTVTMIEPSAAGPLSMTIRGTVEVPLVLERNEALAPLARDAVGRTRNNGTFTVPYVLVVARSVTSPPAMAPAARAAVFGHELFGSRNDIETGGVPELANAMRFIFGAVDWIGASGAERTATLDAFATEPARAGNIVDRLMQGLLAQMALEIALSVHVSGLPELRSGGFPIFDAADIYYLGRGFSHYIGGTYGAASSTVNRLALVGGGANASLLLGRSHALAPIAAAIRALAPDPLDEQKSIVFFQEVLDRIDPLTYAPHVRTTTYPTAPTSRHVLVQVGRNDSEYSNLGAAIHLRALGVPLIRPLSGAFELVGEADSPSSSGATIFDFGVTATPDGATDNRVHAALLANTDGWNQVSLFLNRAGEVQHPCTGPCTGTLP